MSNGAPSPIPVTTIDQYGVHVPAYADVLAALQAQFQYIYGSDIDWDNSTQDSEWVQLLAAAFTTANNMGAAVYNAFSPTTAQGAGLSSVVAINGIERETPSNSTVGVLIVGVPNYQINNGVAMDNNQNYWNLPAIVIIPSSGEILVTATCQTEGAIPCSPGGIVSMAGAYGNNVQSVTNPTAATLGAPVEDDAELRQRQTVSASLPSVSSINGLEAAIAAIPGVTAYRVYENGDPATDDNGVAGKSVAVVVSGGDLQLVTDTIALKKGNGCGTCGDLSFYSTADANGVTRLIHFSAIHQTPIIASLWVNPGNGFTSDVVLAIQTAVANALNNLGIGGDVFLEDMKIAARLLGQPYGNTFTIVPNSMLIARSSNMLSASDIDMAYNESPNAVVSSIVVNLVQNG